MKLLNFACCITFTERRGKVNAANFETSGAANVHLNTGITQEEEATLRTLFPISSIKHGGTPNLT